MVPVVEKVTVLSIIRLVHKYEIRVAFTIAGELQDEIQYNDPFQRKVSVCIWLSKL